MTTPTDKTELLPCPFCGGKAEIICDGPTKEQLHHAISWGSDYDVSYAAQCSSCAISTINCHSRNVLANGWNTRTPDPLLADAIEALRVIVKDEYESDNFDDDISKAQKILAKYDGRK